MKTRNRSRRVRLLIALGILLSVGLLSGGEDLNGVGVGEGVPVHGIALARFGSAIAVMGQLTLNGVPLQGTFFFLYYDPYGEEAKEQCGLQQEYFFPEGVVANGAQVSFIQYPNAIVTFTINPSQFMHGYTYDLPFLPEDPPGMGALEFF